MGRRRHLPPFECEVTELGPKGVGIGVAPDGKPVHVRGAPVGGRVAVVPQGRSKGRWMGRRTALIRPPVGYAEPRCPQFGACGGCVLQELDLATQRRAKHTFAMAQVGAPPDAVDHGARGAPAAYAYRNKMELSFGPRRWLTEAEHQAGLPVEGRFLGLHAPGRFDRVVDAPHCDLMSEAANSLLARVREVALRPDAPMPWDTHTRTGFWRHLLIREAADGLLVVVFTASGEPGDAAWMDRVAAALDGTVVGLEWRLNDQVADVARGEVARTWGRPWLEERLGGVTLRISPTSFFQTSTAGCEVLYDTIGEALGRGGTLLDLYCGAGSIGLYLADRFDRIVGLEEIAAAVDDARANAERNGVAAEFRAVKVEDALEVLQGGPDVHVVVDPPRAGLHPKVARALAGIEVGSLVYVACNPASLGRDAALLAEGGWRITDLWTVDLFPQTGHVEVVARLVR